MNIHESAEDYLEAILVLKEKQGMVRSIDVVHYLDYSKPSVSVAMKRLREKLGNPACLKTIRSFGYRMEDAL